jgi:hypothetical protein
MLIAPLACAALIALSPALADVVEPDFGFALEVPDGWRIEEEARTSRSLRLVLLPDGDLTTRLTLSVNPDGTDGLTAEGSRDLSLASLAARDDVSASEATQIKVLGDVVPGLLVDIELSGIGMRVSQAFVPWDDDLLALQVLSPAGEFERRAREFDTIWKGLTRIEASPGRAERLLLERLAARCGTEVDWADDWADAAARARATDRPILVWAHVYGGFSITDGTMVDEFMDEDILALLAARFVPLRLGKSDITPLHDGENYGLGPNTFGTAALVCTPEGRVLDESLFLYEPFLRRALALTDSEAPMPPRGSSVEQQVRHWLDVGELERARETLGTPESAEGWRLMAACHVRDLDAQAALDALARADDAPGAEEAWVEVAADRVQMLAAVDRVDEALALAELVAERHGDDPRAAEVAVVEARLRWHHEDQAAARTVLMGVIERDPESRWAAQAAGIMSSTAWTIDRTAPTRWPDVEDLDVLRPVDPAAATDDLEAAREGALAWLLARQDADGSWPFLDALNAEEGDPPGDLHLAMVSLATRALLLHDDRPEVAAAAERGLAWILEGFDLLRREGEPPIFLDYTIWSRACLLELFGELAKRDPGRRETLTPHVTAALDDLEDHRQPGGGWSYYLSTSAEATGPPPDTAMSFSTALIVMGLTSCRDAGFDVPEELIDDGLTALQVMRSDDGAFEYMRGSARAGVEESAGRMPVCTLALHAGGRASDRELTDALKAFDEFRGTYSSERGKALMHTGPLGQGSHYLLFDDAYAARAVAELPKRKRKAFTKAIVEELMACREHDGAFVDNPIVGREAGTALALLALAWLEDGAHAVRR